MPLENAFQTFPRLETENLVLRRIKIADAEALFAVLSDSEVTRYYDDDPYVNISQAREQIESWENGFNRRFMLRLGITRKGEDRLIGSCGYYGFHTLHLHASIGYELARPYWQKGIMTEALHAIVDFGFREMALRRLQAFVMPGNTGSIKLLEKLGFQNEGLLREYETWGAKGFVDLFSFSLLRREWNG